MSTESKKIDILELHWTHNLNDAQHRAWILCAKMCPSTVAQKKGSYKTGKAFFIACNLKRMV